MTEFSTKQRERLSEEKLALPDGSYPIRNVSDLKNAIASYGRAKNPEQVKRWIIKRAKALGAEDLIPESWLKDSPDIAHYGVRGMKWGVRKAIRKSSKSERLSRKAEKYEAKSAAAKLRAAKLHNKYDLAGAGRLGVKAARKNKKAVAYDRKAKAAIKSGNEKQALKYQSLAEKNRYKAAKNESKSNTLDRSKGYGVRAEKAASKADKYAKKAAKAKMKIANNDRYIDMMSRKANSFARKDKDRGQAFISQLNALKKKKK